MGTLFKLLTTTVDRSTMPSNPDNYVMPRVADGITFTKWFNSLGLKHFKAAEVEWYFSRVRNGVKNSYPPRKKWHRIKWAFLALDELRSRLGVPIEINSTYRSPAYNRAVGGAPASQHVQFKAIDFVARGVSPSKVASETRKLRSEGAFKGGIGTYRTFVHIDTRGHNVDW